MAIYTDVIDRANDLAQDERDHALAKIQQEAADMPHGVPGECDLCGEWSGRLVGGVCAPCRDLHRMP